MKLKPLTSGQIRAARAFLRWRAEDLARESTVGVATIRRAELTEAETSMTAPNDLAIRRALEAAGVEFIARMAEARGCVYGSVDAYVFRGDYTALAPSCSARIIRATISGNLTVGRQSSK